jgi:hypothetical protein
MHACSSPLIPGTAAGLAGLLGHGVQPKAAAAPQEGKTVDVPVKTVDVPVKTGDVPVKTVDVPVIVPKNETVEVPIYKPVVESKPVTVRTALLCCRATPA